MKRIDKRPKFKTTAEARAFWKMTDSTDSVDWTKAKPVVFTNLKPTLRSISLRLPEMMIDELKILANKRDIPYRALLKQFLSERIAAEFKDLSQPI